MRISELATTAGLPIATVKYYLREQLLPPGRVVTERLAEYDEGHLRRLALLRILREVGDIPVARLRGLVAAVDDRRLSIHQLFGQACDAIAPVPPAPTQGRARARAVAEQVIASAGWDRIRQDSVDRENLAAALEVIHAFRTHPGDAAALQGYAQIADTVARADIESLDDSKDRAGLLEEMVVGQVVFGQVLAILRRLAEEHHSYLRFADDHRA